jgi:uncharacterized membrane protein YdbT with pleckstrin-like domain
MSRRMDWRDGEESLVSITPVAEGLFRPFLSLVTAIVLVQFGASHVRFIHQHEWLLYLIFAGPCTLVFLTRMWRWRSYKVRVTSERIIVEGGVTGHFRSSVELHDVFSSRVEQRVTERIMRRGSVILETAGGTMDTGQVRHPAALCRVIDLQRDSHRNHGVPLDTVFEFEHPDPHDYFVNPQPRRGRHERD